MSNVVQIQQTTQTGKQRSASCIPMRPGWRYHTRRADFYAICKGDWICADALRVCENETNALVKGLRSKYDIPVDTLPHEDDLWFTERLEDFEYLSIQSTKRSSYARSLYEVSRSKTKRSLIELGFLRIRFVAWAGINPVLPDTTIYLGMRGKQQDSFILVDSNGDYIDSQGQRRSAAEQGWTAIERQFLCEIDKINEALAELDGVAPVKLRRWHSLRRKKKSAVVPGETTKSAPGSAPKNDHGRSRNTAPQGVLKDSLNSFDSENTINGDALSLEMAENPLKELADGDIRRAAWTAETLIALTVYHLAVPDRDTCDDEQWRKDWLEPAQWLIEQTIDLDPSRAWERIECHIGAMISGPTWHARHAARPFTAATLTLRHVVGTKKGTQTLDGHAWRSTAEALRKEPWAVEVHIDYFGPSLFAESSQPAQSSYAQGYTGTRSEQASSADCEDSAQTIEVVAQAPLGVRTTKPLRAEDAQTAHDEPAQAVVIVEDVAHDLRDEVTQGIAQPPVEPLVVDAQQGDGDVTQGNIVVGMDGRSAEMAEVRIRKHCPNAIVDTVEVSPGLFAVGVQYALDAWYDFLLLRETRLLSEEASQRLAQAEEYGKSQRAAANGNDAHGPPGDAQLGEGGGDSYGS